MLGWPVRHSRSPAIQNAALAAAGLHVWRYQLLPVPPELLGEVVPALPAAGFAGANVTIPHKPAALALAGEATERARAIGAANTLTFTGAPGAVAISADNTDAPALIAALPVPVAGRTALVLGAGGSARAAVWALLDAGAAEVRVWNRTADRARQLCAELGGVPAAAPGPAWTFSSTARRPGWTAAPRLTSSRCAERSRPLRSRRRLRLCAGAGRRSSRGPARSPCPRSTGSSCSSARERSASSASPAPRVAGGDAGRRAPAGER